MKRLILEDIRSAHNVGSIFRTADGAGVFEIFLVGYTPAPIDRFGRTQPEIKKTALGATENITWHHVATTEEAIAQARAAESSIVAVEQHASAQSLADFSVPTSVCYVLGNEVDGLASETLAATDAIVEIPMLGTKESLNVAVAAGIVLYYGVASK